MDTQKPNLVRENEMEERIELKAIKFAENYYKKNGWKVINVSRKGGQHSGYDLLLTKGPKQKG